MAPQPQSSWSVRLRAAVCAAVVLLSAAGAATADEPSEPRLIARPGLFEPLTEPPCSYCSTQHRKGLIEREDRVVAWLRARHNGGAFPLRHFLAGPRVVNDTYGLFFYDPDGGYVAAYRKDYGYRFHGWRNGVMVAEGPDGTLWSALSGRALAGPKKGERLERIPSLATTWEHWLMLHPESTAYDLFEGETYRPVPLPAGLAREAAQTMGEPDRRLEPLTDVLGIEAGGTTKAYRLDAAEERACVNDVLGDEPVAVFWYGPTRTAVAWSRNLDGRVLTFRADGIAPETAPFVDRETGTRWTLAGRAVDGRLKGKELTWIPSLQCRWYAWAAEYPETLLYDPEPDDSRGE